jgi:hypothetical protein
LTSCCIVCCGFVVRQPTAWVVCLRRGSST